MKKTWHYDAKLAAAYATLQAESGIEVGDTVKILRPYSDLEMGFSCITGARCVGEEHRVTKVNPNDIRLSNDWHYPFFVLEIVKKRDMPIKVVLNGEHTAEVSPAGVKVGCQTFTLDKIDELMKAVAAVRSR